MKSFDSTMKRCQTEHQRHPLKQFLQSSLAIVRQRSFEYVKDKEPFRNELKISTDIIEKGCALQRNFVHDLEKPNGDVDFYTYRLDLDKDISLADVTNFNSMIYETFDDFAGHAFDIWRITFPKETEEWKQAVCSFPAFDREYMCKHYGSTLVKGP